MDKQKMAEVVLARIRERKEEEERNRPEIQVLRMEAMFLIERHHSIKKDIAALEAELKQSENIFDRLETEGQELDNTAKRNFPRIIVLPEFIAAERVDAKYKDFYRKSGNSFLRMDLLRKKGYASSVQQEQVYVDASLSVQDLRQKVAVLLEEETRNVNRRRQAVLKQQLTLRKIKRWQKELREQIEADYQAHAELQSEYEIKKQLVENSSQRMRQLQDQISHYKQMIQNRYNPQTYRQFLGGSFPFMIKNQTLRRGLDQARREIYLVKHQTIVLENQTKQTRNKSKKRQVGHQTSFLANFSGFLHEGSRKKEPRRLKTQQVPRKLPSMQTEPSLSFPHLASQC